MERLDVAFATRYLDAFDRHHRGEDLSKCWRSAFRAAQSWHPIVLQHLLLGINAYIIPARVGAGTNNGIVTTAAINDRGAEPSWSNFGRCVDIWAPGTRILSTRKGGGTTTDSGTSVASPHVGGIGALYLSSRTGATPATVERSLKRTSVGSGAKSKDGLRIRHVCAGRY